MRLGKDLLVGKSFRDFISGNETYKELLEIFEEVGNEVRTNRKNKRSYKFE
ncbi:MAG: hypothetical protein QXD48_00535 [Candidatus Aenigmatarchaeota archaeon]